MNPSVARWPFLYEQADQKTISILKKLIFKLLHLSGLVSLFRTLKQRRGCDDRTISPTLRRFACERGLRTLKPRYKHYKPRKTYLKARLIGTTDKKKNFWGLIFYGLLPLMTVTRQLSLLSNIRKNMEAPATISFVLLLFIRYFASPLLVYLMPGVAASTEAQKVTKQETESTVSAAIGLKSKRICDSPSTSSRR